MKRSSWKLPFSNQNYIRQSTILPSMVGHWVKVPIGKQFVKVSLDQNLVGYKLGELVWTRSRYIFKKSSKTKKRLLNHGTKS